MDSPGPVSERGTRLPSDPAPTGGNQAHQLHTADQGPAPGASRPSGLTPPFVLGHYRVVEKIGEGGMGAVYRALHGRLKKAVALKLLPPNRTSDSQAVFRFEREMEAIGRLNHNHIVRATDAGEADGVHYLVMELVDGVDLARLVRHCGPLPVAAACELVRQAAAGLQYAHENSLVHRDIKPSNLLLSVDGELKISDLGLALLNRNDAASGELTVTGQVMGTADYMAPEQWEDSHTVDIRADLYSLGCTLYTLLVGSPPFGGPKHRSALRKMAAHAKELVRPITEHRKDVPAPVEELRLRLMAKEPSERPATPAEVVKALEPFCRGAGLASLARGAMALPRPDAAALPEQSTATRNAVAVLSTPACGQTLTAAPASPAQRRHWRPWVVAAAGVGLLAALAAGYRPWLWVGGPAPADPQLPVAAPAPPSESGDVRRLLTESPGKTVWPPAFGARLDVDQKKETAWIQSPQTSLLKLGETNAQSYKLYIGFSQLPWTGGMGVYFGGRPAAGRDNFRFQLIDLRHPEPTKPWEFYLGRSVGLVRKEGGAPPEVGLQGLLKWRLPRPPDNSVQRLELDVRPEPRGLVAVRWNGEWCPELTEGAEGVLADQQADNRGEFGIYCNGCTVTVSMAQLEPLD